MTWWILHTREQVHAVYRVEAETAEEAQLKFEGGELRDNPQLYEALDVEVERVEPLKEA